MYCWSWKELKSSDWRLLTYSMMRSWANFFWSGVPLPQNLLQARDLHHALLDGRVVRVGLQHLEDDRERTVLLFLVDLLLAELAGEEGGRLLGVGAGSGC